ncbi:MAG: hypothetical protein RL477_735 [Pseudomonadota bacterium]
MTDSPSPDPLAAFRDRAAAILAAALSLVALAMSAQLPIVLGVAIYTEQALGVMVGCAIGIVYLAVARSWAALLCAAAGATAAAVLTFRYPVLASNLFAHQVEASILGLVIIPLLIDTIRRRTGWGLVAIILVFIVYAFLADKVPGTLRGRVMAPLDLFAFLTVDTMALFGVPLTISGMVVVSFVFFGQLLTQSGGSEWFTDLAMAATGRSRGGSAKIAVVASGLFGTISGSAVSNVASTGVVTIPLMKQAGFNARTAGAFEAVASTGGQLMPPIMGAAAFLMAEFLQKSYGEIVIAAIIPAFLYYVAVLIQADLEAARNNIPPVPAERIKALGRVLRGGWHFIAPFVVLIVAMFNFNLSAAESALWATATLIALSSIFSYEGRKLDWREMGGALVETGRASTEIILVAAGAGLIIGILENTGLSFAITYILVNMGGGNAALLLVATAVICIILGMGMPTTGIYILVALLAVPPLVQLGVNPLAAHMFVLYFGLMSMISPPVALAAFTAAAMAGASPMATAMTSMRLGWAAFIVPFLFVKSPTLLMQGSAPNILFDVTTAVIGIWLISAALLGYLRDHLGWPTRAAAFVCGAALLIPPGGSEVWIYINVAGLAAGGALIALQYRRKRAAAGA